MKRTLLLLVMVVAGARCATNSEVVEASRLLTTELDRYSSEIAKKAKEQRDFYDARAAHLAQARNDMIERGIDQARVTRAIAAASSMASDPQSVRSASLAQFLLEAYAAEKTLDAELRRQASDAEASLRSALVALETKNKELGEMKVKLGKLNRRPSTRDELRNLATFGKEVADALQDKQK